MKRGKKTKKMYSTEQLTKSTVCTRVKKRSKNGYLFQKSSEEKKGGKTRTLTASSDTHPTHSHTHTHTHTDMGDSHAANVLTRRRPYCMCARIRECMSVSVGGGFLWCDNNNRCNVKHTGEVAIWVLVSSVSENQQGPHLSLFYFVVLVQKNNLLDSLLVSIFGIFETLESRSGIGWYYLNEASL